MERVDLTDLDRTFEDSSEGTDGVPDDEYDVVVTHMEIRETRKGNRILEWTLDILGPAHQGEQVTKVSVLRNDDTLRFLKQDLTRCGVVLQRLSELPDRLGELEGLRLRVAVRTKGRYQNVYLNDCLGRAEDDQADLPF